MTGTGTVVWALGQRICTGEIAVPELAGRDAHVRVEHGHVVRVRSAVPGLRDADHSVRRAERGHDRGLVVLGGRAIHPSALARPGRTAMAIGRALLRRMVVMP